MIFSNRNGTKRREPLRKGWEAGVKGTGSGSRRCGKREVNPTQVLKKYAYFLGLISKRTFRFGFSLPSVDQKNIHSNFFSVTCIPEKPLILSFIFLGLGNFDARYYFGSKISGFRDFLGLQYEAPSDHPVKFSSSTTPLTPTPLPPPPPLALDN